MQKLLRLWAKPGRNDRKSAQKYFIRQLGPGTYLMEANAAIESKRLKEKKSKAAAGDEGEPLYAEEIKTVEDST